MLSSFGIPHRLARPYLILRIGLWLLLIIAGIYFFLALLFPSFTYAFNFRTPNSSRNTLVDPRVNGSSRENGRLSTGESLTADAGAFGDFSLARVSAILEKKSDLPESITASLRRTYRAFLYPTGNPITGFPQTTLYKVGETYYALRDNTLTPFVSVAAYHSNYPEAQAQVKPADFLKEYPLSSDFLGFRVGSLVSFADGVFIVTSETEMRPVGSADVFLNLGYDFKNVIPASEEDLGLYKRGRIITLGTTHPDGTLFEDEDTGTVYIIDHGTKRPVTDESYRAFLTAQQAPILASTTKANITTRCTLQPSLISRTFSCTLSLDPLLASPGSNYELTLSDPDTDIDINTLELSLETRKNKQNVLTLLSQLKQRVLNHLGGGQ